MTKPRVAEAVRLGTNGFVDAHRVSWPGGGLTGCTYDESVRVGQAMAKKLGLPFIDEIRGNRKS